MAYMGFQNLIYIVEGIRDLRTCHWALEFKIFLKFVTVTLAMTRFALGSADYDYDE